MLTNILHLSNYNYGNITYVFLCTILVFLMTPGLAFFYGGLVRKKDSLNIMTKIFLAIGVVSIMWIFGGFSMVFGKDIGGIIGNPFQYFAFRHLLFDINNRYSTSVPFVMFFMYQLMFAIITLPLMTGATATRLTIRGWVKFLIVWMILVYFPVAHWIWGGGFLEKIGFVDFAGGTVIHITAAFSGLVALWYLGKRADGTKKDKPSNLGLVGIGAALLLFGWYGFNAGGTMSANDRAAIIFTNTGVAAVVAMIVWTIISYYHDGHHFSFLQPLVGAIAGLATITPASGYVTPRGAIIIGALAAIICYLCVQFADKMGWDDALDVWGVHGMGGLSGTLLIGFLANPLVNGVHAGVHQFLIQLAGVAIVIAYVMLITWLILFVLDKITKIRTTKEEQINGLDNTLLDEKYFGFDNDSILNQNQLEALKKNTNDFKNSNKNPKHK